MNMFDLTGKVALVTGGAHSIGFSLGLGLAQAGAKVCFNCSSEGSRERGMKAYADAGVEVHGYVADVTKEDQVKAMIAKIEEEVGTVDILVNNAGINKLAPAEEMSLEIWQKIVDVNFTGTFMMCRDFGALMLEQGHGNIVNIASISGLVVNPLPQQQCAYNSTKAGVIMLTKCMANEWAQRGVRVNAVCPGFTRTPLTAKRLSTPNDPAVQKWIGGTPMNRVAEPSEMVGLALYFASDASSFTTGAVMAVDGGYTCL